jgi:DNA-binding transcriptional LysR family regulator
MLFGIGIECVRIDVASRSPLLNTKESDMTSTRIKTVLLEASSVRYFREAASAGSIRRAAETLYISPSALTRQIAKLEVLLGAKLLDRRARGVTLTDTGKVLLNFSEQSLLRINEMIGSIDDMQHMRTGLVRIASVEGVVTTLLSESIVQFQKAHANVSISLSVLSSRAVVEAVLSGEVEMGFAFEPQKLGELRFVESIVQPLCVIARADHPLAKKRILQMRDMAKHPFVLPNVSFGLRQIFDRAAAAEGIDIIPAVETNSIEAVKTLVRNSPTFLTILPRFLIEQEIQRNELRAIPIDEPLLSSARAVLVVRKDKFLSQAALQFISDLTQRIAAAQKA